MHAYDIRRLDSLHEAGHAVAAVVLGGRIEIVTGDHMILAEESDLHPWHDAVVCYAGAMAARELGPNVRAMSRSVSDTDREAALRALARIGCGSGDLPAVERQARELVRRHDGSIRRVASALRERGSLDHEGVLRAMGWPVPASREAPSEAPPAVHQDTPRPATGSRECHCAGCREYARRGFVPYGAHAWLVPADWRP